MEGCPEAVKAALGRLSERLRPEAEIELATLRQAKRAFGAGPLEVGPPGGEATAEVQRRAQIMTNSATGVLVLLGAAVSIGLKALASSEKLDDR